MLPRFFILLLGAVVTGAPAVVQDVEDLGIQETFASWKLKFDKGYATVEDEARALARFLENEAIIQEHNSKGLSYWLGHNEFSDMNAEEFRVSGRTGGVLPEGPAQAARRAQRVHISDPRVAKPLADSVDWVAKGAVTPPKNQGRCGSCWSFSTTGSLEGALEISSGMLTSLSEEELVQCDETDNGCNGGLMDQAFAYVEEHGLCSETDYPYSSGNGTRGKCPPRLSCKSVVKVSGFKDVPHADEDALKDAVSIGPVSIAIEADKSVFQLYKGGVLDNDKCGQKLDHGVLVVGYGTDSDSGKDFWKVKNSWGPTWGEEGYIRFVRGKNQCGVASQASYPTGVKRAAPAPPSPPGPTPPPPPPPTNSTHYGNPTNGCLDDEAAISISGVRGDICAPHCSFLKACPKDKPTGVTAKPACALSSSSGEFCALECGEDDDCDKGASCRTVGANVSICLYFQG